MKLTRLSVIATVTLADVARPKLFQVLEQLSKARLRIRGGYTAMY